MGVMFVCRSELTDMLMLMFVCRSELTHMWVLIFVCRSELTRIQKMVERRISALKDEVQVHTANSFVSVKHPSCVWGGGGYVHLCQCVYPKYVCMSVCCLDYLYL